MRQQSRAHTAQLKTFSPVRCRRCKPPSSRTVPARGTIASLYLHLGKPHSQYTSHRPPQRHPQNWKPPGPLEKASQLWSAAKARVAILNATRGWRKSSEEGNGGAGPQTPGSASLLAGGPAPSSPEQPRAPRAARRAAEMPHCRHRLQPLKELIQISRKETLCDQMLKRCGPWGHQCVSKNNWSLLS